MNIKQGVNQLVFWCLCLYKVNLSDFFFYYFIFSYIREILFKDTTIHSYYYYWRNVTLKIFSTYLWNAKERSSYQNIYIFYLFIEISSNWTTLLHSHWSLPFLWSRTNVHIYRTYLITLLLITWAFIERENYYLFFN